MNTDDLTITQIKALSRYARCCYHIAPWNNSFIYVSIEDWARQIGWQGFMKELSTVDDAKQDAIDAVSKLIALIDELVYL